MRTLGVLVAGTTTDHRNVGQRARDTAKYDKVRIRERWVRVLHKLLNTKSPKRDPTIVDPAVDETMGLIRWKAVGQDLSLIHI